MTVFSLCADFNLSSKRVVILSHLEGNQVNQKVNLIKKEENFRLQGKGSSKCQRSLY